LMHKLHWQVFLFLRNYSCNRQIKGEFDLFQKQ